MKMGSFKMSFSLDRVRSVKEPNLSRKQYNMNQAAFNNLFLEEVIYVLYFFIHIYALCFIMCLVVLIQVSSVYVTLLSVIFSFCVWLLI